MTGLIVKLIICPIGIILASWIFPNVDFAYWYQPIIIGAVLAIIGYFVEVAMLQEDTNWLNTIMDFAASTLVIYFGAMFFADTEVTFWGAVLTGALLAITEIFQHNWLLQSGRVRNNPVSE